jgi:hypothetical protein
MREAQRDWSITTVTVLALLFLTAIGNAVLMVGGAGLLFVVAWIALPRQRARGALAAAIAACIAVVFAALLR